MISDHLTTKQVAAHLGVNLRRVHYLIERGELVGVQLDGPHSPYLFKVDDVERVAARLAEGAA
jgi:excisionase family DNA binding protein